MSRPQKLEIVLSPLRLLLSARRDPAAGPIPAHSLPGQHLGRKTLPLLIKVFSNALYDLHTDVGAALFNPVGLQAWPLFLSAEY